MATPANDSFAVPSGVIAGGRNVFFSSGSETGSYNAGTQTWTPGRDAQGVVTRASWELVPTDGTWVEVAGTAFTTQVQPLLSAALPAYNDPGSGDLAGVLDAYNGFAHDVSGGRVFAHGGGHYDSANNGVYRCDLKKLTWAIAKLPDMQTHWDSAYNKAVPDSGSFTGYTRANAAVSANPTTTDFYGDEFYDLVEPLASTRNPTARHTYEAMTFYGGKLRHGVRRYWEWDEATGIWTSRYPMNKNATTHGTDNESYCGEAVKGTWDEVNNRYICTPVQTGGEPATGWAWSADTQTWNHPSGLLGGWGCYASTFARRGRTWCSFARPTYQGNYWPISLRVWNLDTEAVTGISLTGLTQSKCIDANFYDESTVMVYVDAVDKFFVMMPYDANDTYAASAALPLEGFWIDPTAGTMTHEVQTGKFPALTAWALIKSKIFYVPQIKAIVMFHAGTANARIRRLP